MTAERGAPRRRRRPDGRSRPHRALAGFGVDDARVRPVPRGSNSWNWYVDAPGRRLVLRRFNPFRTRDEIRYELDVLDRLAAARWSVPQPVPSPPGERIVVVDGCMYGLFRRLEGTIRWPKDHEGVARIGTLTAELHRATVELLDLGPRPGWPPLAEYATRRRPPEGRNFAEAIVELRGEHPALAARIEGHHRATQDALAGRAAGLSRTVVHGDFHPGNLLRAGPKLTGILDFDFVRPDARIADIATTWGFFDDPDDRAAIVAGYERIAPLSDLERELLGPMRAASDLAHAAGALSFWTSGREDMLADVERAADLLDRDASHRTRSRTRRQR